MHAAYFHLFFFSQLALQAKRIRDFAERTMRVARHGVEVKRGDGVYFSTTHTLFLLEGIVNGMYMCFVWHT